MFNYDYDDYEEPEIYPIGFAEGPPLPKPPWPKGARRCRWCSGPTYHRSGYCSRYCQVDAPAEVARLCGKED